MKTGLIHVKIQNNFHLLLNLLINHIELKEMCPIYIAKYILARNILGEEFFTLYTHWGILLD